MIREKHTERTGARTSPIPSIPRRWVLQTRPVVLGMCLLGAGCATGPKPPDLGRLYDRSAQYHGVDRNPVIVIPGVLGSRLEQAGSGRPVWGAFSGEYINPRDPAGARLAALPMRPGETLADLRDDVKSTAALDRIEFRLFGLPLELQAYANILGVLGAGGYRDEELAGVIDYGTDHFTCFQFHYDWRRSNVENARALHDFILEKKAFVAGILERDYGAENPEIEFDIVAHSMGGMITRYFLRYGDQPLPADGSLPDLTWAGAEHVDRAILIGTPNAGSPEVLFRLKEGLSLGPFGTYPAAVLATFPSLYELMPRPRHRALVSGSAPPEALDFYDPAFWEDQAWGLADPGQAGAIAGLLPDMADPDARREAALEHLAKCLANAKQVHAAIDAPASPPPGLKLYLVAGDSELTYHQLEADNGSLEVAAYGPGDGTVPRYSALMDERQGGAWRPFLDSPISWNHVTFMFNDHLGMTMDPAFMDNVLYLLLEAPR